MSRLGIYISVKQKYSLFVECCASIFHIDSD